MLDVRVGLSSHLLICTRTCVRSIVTVSQALASRLTLPGQLGTLLEVQLRAQMAHIEAYGGGTVGTA
jgi:hypothetical protein